MKRHPLVAALLGAIGGIFAAQAYSMDLGRAGADAPPAASLSRGKRAAKRHDRGGTRAAQRQALKARNVKRNRRAHR